MATTKPRKKRSSEVVPKPQPKAAEALGTAEILEMILLELGRDLQQNQKSKKRLEPANTFAKLRGVSSFFKGSIDGSKKIQELLGKSGYRTNTVPAPLDWLFKNKLKIFISRDAFSTTPKHIVVKLQDHRLKDLRHNLGPIRPFLKYQYHEKAMWRNIQIASLDDKLRNVTIRVSDSFRDCDRCERRDRRDRPVPKLIRLKPHDTLDTALIRFLKATDEALEKHQMHNGEVRGLHDALRFDDSSVDRHLQMKEPQHHHKEELLHERISSIVGKLTAVQERRWSRGKITSILGEERASVAIKRAEQNKIHSERLVSRMFPSMPTSRCTR